MGNKAVTKSRHCCLCVLVLAFLFGSGVWLKLILCDVLSFDLSYDLLYEREFLPYSQAKWHVARGLNISADLSVCSTNRAPKKRLLADEDAFAGSVVTDDENVKAEKLAPAASPPLPHQPPPPSPQSPPPDHAFAPPNPSPSPDDAGECEVGQAQTGGQRGGGGRKRDMHTQFQLLHLTSAYEAGK